MRKAIFVIVCETYFLRGKKLEFGGGKSQVPPPPPTVWIPDIAFDQTVWFTNLFIYSYTCTMYNEWAE